MARIASRRTMEPLDGQRTNRDVAGRLDEVAAILERQGAGHFRVRAYRAAAETLRNTPRQASEILDTEGLPGLEALPGIGVSIARFIKEVLTTGRLAMLDRLRGTLDPVALLQSVPGIGKRTALRLHYDLDIDTLEDLEAAAHDGRLERLAGLGPKRLAGLREVLAQRLGRLRPQAPAAEELPPVPEILDVDREYLERQAELPRIAPRRMNEARKAWLPVLHTQRGQRQYTALFSNTPRAHQAKATRDWVVVYEESPGHSQATVITARYGPLAGRRIVRGREEECASHQVAATAAALLSGDAVV